MERSAAGKRHYWIETLAGPMATLLGILVGAFTVIYTVEANNDAEARRLKAAEVAQQEAQAASFELAAAQIVMAQRSCALATARAKQLVRIFPSRLNTASFQRLTKRQSKKVCKALRRTNPPPSGSGGLGFLVPFLFG